MSRRVLAVLVAGILALTGGIAVGQTKVPGVSDTEILIGQTLPYSGPVSSAATIGRAYAAYFTMLNDRGGINGRKVRLLSVDDGFSPPKTLEQTRKLVEEDDVLLIFGSLGTATNRATEKYLNARHVPQIFINTGASIFNDPKDSPYTMSGVPSYGTEAKIFAQYILKHLPDARIAILSQNDDYGRDYVNTLKSELGDKAGTMIVAQATYELSEPTIASQIVTLKDSNADVLLNLTLGKFAAQAVQRVQELGWTPIQFIPYLISSPKVFLLGGDAKKAAGIITTAFAKTAADPTLKDDPEYREWLAWMTKYYPAGDVTDDLNVYAYIQAELLAHVLSIAGNDLSRDNVMRIATNLQHVRVPMMLPGIEVNTSSTDHSLMKDLQLLRFDGTQWQKIGH